MYPRIPQELVAEPLGTMEHSLGTIVIENKKLSTLYDTQDVLHQYITSSMYCKKKYNFLSVTDTERLMKMMV